MKTKSILIGIILISISDGGCRKKNPNVMPIDSYAASFFTGYQPGTYWVYQDSTGLITDSERVTYSHCGPYINYPNYEYCDLFISSDTLTDNENFEVIRYDSLTEAGIEFDADKPGLNEIYGIYFTNNNIDTIDTLYNQGTLIKKIATYQVNQFVFNNALKIACNPPGNPYPMYIIIVPNIGVVERMVPDSGYVLKLKRYHIVS